ncbi:alpha/beta hydrolase [Kitasatospora sp. GP82]|uniref:alpha/beta hydrolase n=1 Tax=Kitasatospora sp. GP82 TaxID=3035089 RepID=UPI0024751637|nr:alpha/beta hydrolase [Kitasatospora sp. GP82]MDH6127012.1 pimeloyl-ACP methyl ester carboxylesterase [Kitasatospora sp. GP82]
MPIIHRTAATLAAASAVLSLAAPVARASGASESPLSWGSCQGTGLDSRQRCATVSVPLDYSRPHGEQITIAVSRIAGEQPGQRRGVLLLIPGGPGGSGLNGPSSAVKRLPQAVRDAYDIVGFDPRGVGRSTPVSCDLAHEDLSMVRLRPWPAPDGGIARNVETARRIATTCNDVVWPRSTAGYQQAVTTDRAAHPLTAGMPVNVMPCSFWPAPPAEAPVEVTPDGPSNILLVQNLRDPATPFSGALRLREAFGARARMVAVDSGGHDAYLANGNACGDRTVTDFLLNGRRPARDVLCR